MSISKETDDNWMGSDSSHTGSSQSASSFSAFRARRVRIPIGVPRIFSNGIRQSSTSWNSKSGMCFWISSPAPSGTAMRSAERVELFQGLLSCARTRGGWAGDGLAETRGRCRGPKRSTLPACRGVGEEDSRAWREIKKLRGECGKREMREEDFSKHRGKANGLSVQDEGRAGFGLDAGGRSRWGAGPHNQGASSQLEVRLFSNVAASHGLRFVYSKPDRLLETLRRVEELK
jgi:hypothetical protein